MLAGVDSCEDVVVVFSSVVVVVSTVVVVVLVVVVVCSVVDVEWSADLDVEDLVVVGSSVVAKKVRSFNENYVGQL